MPGLVGLASSRPPDAVRRRFEVACQRMARHGRMVASTLDVEPGGCHAGRLTLGGDARDRHLASADRPQALVHGVVYNTRELAEVGGEVPGSAPSADDLVATLYARQGVGFVDALRGEFALVVVDPSRQQVVLASDAVGNYPIYWRHDTDGLIFGSDLSAVLAATPSARQLDLAAVADYVTMGAVLGDKTLARGVQLLSPGTVLVYDMRQDRVSLQKYLELATFFAPREGNRQEYLERVQHAFASAVDRSLTGTSQFGLSLSGGLDSRAILSATNGRAASLRTYTLGVDGCADQVIAQKLAAIAGTQHVFFELDRTYLRDFLPNMARMASITDGMYLSHGLTEMLALQFLEQTGMAILLRGHGGELAKAHLAWPLHTDPHVYELQSVSDLIAYLSRRANYVTPDVTLARFLTPDAAAAAGDGSRTSFSAVLAGQPLSPAAACSYLYLRELNRRFTVPSLELFRTRVDVRLPFVDREFLEVLLAAPPEWRDNTDIHRAITGQGIPRLLQVRNSNTGAPAGAGAKTEFVLDKMNSLLKRLHVHGYRHYHDFDAWMRSMLLESVEAELLAPGARVSSFVSRPALETLVRETRDAAADHGYLLQVLLILELWQRENGVEAAA